MGFLRWPWTRDNPPSAQTSTAVDRDASRELSERDAASLAALLGAGADLTEPRHVLYFMYFASAEDAEQAATVARQWGFTAEVGSSTTQPSNEWSVICESRGLILERETVRGNSERFDALATANQGDFDGWEASI